MWFLPFARVSFDSHHSPDELLATLQRITRPHRHELRFTRPKETATFVGEVSKERLEFRRAFHGRNSFAPYIVGRIVQGPSGARIEAVLRPHTIALVFMAAWLVLLTPWAVIGISQLLEQGARSEMGAWIPLAMWVAIYPMCMLGYFPEALKMRKILREITNGASRFE